MNMEKQKKKPFNYREQHAVIVIVDTEPEQKQLFEKLKKIGLKNLKVVSV